jgi:hypothetical protein
MNRISLLLGLRAGRPGPSPERRTGDGRIDIGRDDSFADASRRVRGAAFHRYERRSPAGVGTIPAARE